MGKARPSYLGPGVEPHAPPDARPAARQELLRLRYLAHQDPGLFLDVGANNGISAAGFHRIIPKYDIVSIEASRHHEKALQRLERSIPGFSYRRLGPGSSRGSCT